MLITSYSFDDKIIRIYLSFKNFPILIKMVLYLLLIYSHQLSFTTLF